MKKLNKLFALLLVLAFTISMIACSSIGKVEKALKNIGYVAAQGEDANNESKKYDEESIAKIHIYAKGDTIKIYVVVLEFNSTEEMINYYKESSTLQGFIEDLSKNEDVKVIHQKLEEVGLVCNNCLIIPNLIDTVQILSAISELNK